MSPRCAIKNIVKWKKKCIDHEIETKQKNLATKMNHQDCRLEICWENINIYNRIERIGGGGGGEHIYPKKKIGPNWNYIVESKIHDWNSNYLWVGLLLFVVCLFVCGVFVLLLLVFRCLFRFCFGFVCLLFCLLLLLLLFKRRNSQQYWILLLNSHFLFLVIIHMLIST